MELIQYTKNNQPRWQLSLIQCYKQVFAAPPWNEAWWTDELVLDVLRRYGGDNAKIILAVADGDVVGFSWGAKWLSDELSDELELSLPYPSDTRVGYLKDIGMKEEYRQSGVAKTLLANLLTSLLPSSEVMLARTLAWPQPSVVYTWFPRHGFRTVATYPDDGSRTGQVILGCNATDITF